MFTQPLIQADIEENIKAPRHWPIRGEFSNAFNSLFMPTVELHNYSALLTLSVFVCVQEPGGRLNKKDGLTRYGDSHVKDKTS